MLSKCALKDKLIKKQIFLDGQAYTVIMMPNPKIGAGEPVMIFLTTLPNARKAAELYAKRWDSIQVQWLFLRPLLLCCRKSPPHRLLPLRCLSTTLSSKRDGNCSA